MYCSKCGKELDDSAVVCPGCGCPTENYKIAPQTSSEDAPSGGYAVLGFFFPLIGLILYLAWKDQTPLRAKSAAKGAIIGVIVSFVIGLISGIISAVAIAAVV